MRTSAVSCILFAAACLIGACSHGKNNDRTPATASSTNSTLPPGPEYTEPGPPAQPTENPASESPGVAGHQAIPPEDQVMFGFNSSSLDDQAKKALDDVAGWVKENRDRTILVQGHADTTGNANYNMELSAKRAEAVAAYLKAHGVPDDQVMISAMGEGGAQARPKDANRRVIVFATSVETTQ